MADVRLTSQPIPYPCPDPEEANRSVIAAARSLVCRARAELRDFRPPFDPEDYARVLGIPVIKKRAMGEWDALLVPLGSRPLIICNVSVRSCRRRRFSLAHEIAHTFFDNIHTAHQMRTNRQEQGQTTPDSRLLERLCNLGAGELLMPRPWLDELLRETGFSSLAVPRTAERFGVSLEAAAVRLVEVCPEPCAAGFFHLAAQPSFENPRPSARLPKHRKVTYRARRVFRSRGFPFLFPAGKSVPEDSVVYQASLSTRELEEVEPYSLANTTHRLHAFAHALHRDDAPDEPPTVCAFFCMS